MGCDHNCDNCKSNCGSKSNVIEKLKPAKGTSIKKIIGISSGKGGVGKSFVTSIIASHLQKKGYKCGILDGDILGPSIPRAFGIKVLNIFSNENGLMSPIITDTGVKIISSNLMLDDETTPIIYRGALLSGVIQQFFQEVDYGELDFLFIDMPPGTGDIPLTVYQSIPIDKVIIVSSPQQLVSMIVKKSINMAKTMNIEILGLVENMSYVECENCNEKIEVFGKSDIENVAKENSLDVLAKIPLKASWTNTINNGSIEELDIKEIDNMLVKIESLIK